MLWTTFKGFLNGTSLHEIRDLYNPEGPNSEVRETIIRSKTLIFTCPIFLLIPTAVQ